MLECFLRLSWLRGRPDQMALECLSWRVQSTSWRAQTHLQYASISSGSTELPLSYPEVTALLCMCFCVRSCSKGNSSTVRGSTWATSPTKRSVWRQDTAGPAANTTLTIWDRFVSDMHIFVLLHLSEPPTPDPPHPPHPSPCHEF